MHAYDAQGLTRTRFFDEGALAKPGFELGGLLLAEDGTSVLFELHRLDAKNGGYAETALWLRKPGEKAPRKIASGKPGQVGRPLWHDGQQLLSATWADDGETADSLVLDDLASTGAQRRTLLAYRRSPTGKNTGAPAQVRAWAGKAYLLDASAPPSLEHELVSVGLGDGATERLLTGCGEAFAVSPDAAFVACAGARRSGHRGRAAVLVRHLASGRTWNLEVPESEAAGIRSMEFVTDPR